MLFKGALLILLFFSGTLIAQERFVVYFDNNKFELNPLELVKLDKWILENKTSKIISITGSTDEIGSLGYNDTLSKKRVNFIYSKVIGKLKIREDFKTISLGEKGATSDNNAENRKAELKIYRRDAKDAKGRKGEWMFDVWVSAMNRPSPARRSLPIQNPKFKISSSSL